MPLWSVIYLIAFILLVGVGTYDEFRARGEPPLVSVLDAISAIVCAWLFIVYWFSGWRQPLGVLAPYLYVVAIGWQLYDTPRGLRAFFANDDFTAGEKRWLLAGGLIFLAPVVVFAGIAAFR